MQDSTNVRTDDSITIRSADQRNAEPGEPCCVVCGRYGEYICDETDDDVCSLECKAAVLYRKAASGSSSCSIRESDVIGLSAPSLCVSSNSIAGSNVDSTSTTVSNAKKSGPLLDSIQDLEDECILVKAEGCLKLSEWEPSRSIKQLTPQQVDLLRKEIEITVDGVDVPSPILEFADCNFPSKLQINLETAGFETPTPVQMQVIPSVLKNRDILVSGGTGSGKTAAYLLALLAMINRIRNFHRFETREPLAILLAPTRELCTHIEEQAKIFAKGLLVKTALVVGGDAMPQQLYRIKQGVELVIATPGRLVDLLAKHDVSLDSVCLLVLDEVDCLLEQGFRDQVMQVIRALSRPQTMMFSATIPSSIEKFAATILTNPLFISVGKVNMPSMAVKQTIIWVESKDKKRKLFDILKSTIHFRPPAVVFVNSRIGADMLAESIHTVTGLQTAAIHGEKPMQERRRVVKSFLMSELPVVVATGVLSRGLDLLRGSQVIVFDMPVSVQEYIHQIGRASRLGLPGSALVFLNNDSKALFKELIQIFRNSQANLPKELLNSPYSVSSYAVAYNSKKRKNYHRAG